MNTHYFWALSIPQAAKNAIAHQLEEVRGHFPFKRWVDKDDYHITFAFLGSAEKDLLQRSIDLIGESIKSEKTFPLQVQGLGVFGNKKSPRIFWASIKQENMLESVQSLVFTACLKTGFTLEKRPFTPHITLARNWQGTEFNHAWLVSENPFQQDPITFTANEVTLYKTNLEKRPKYEPIATFSLATE